MSGAAEARDLRKGQELRKDLLARCGLEPVGGKGRLHVEASGFGAAQGVEMSAASQVVPDVMGIGPDIETLAADHPEVHLRRLSTEDLVRVDVDETGISLHCLSLTGQLVQGDPVLFDRGDHRGCLVEITVVFGKGCLKLE